jgi:hypothetical protein
MAKKTHLQMPIYFKEDNLLVQDIDCVVETGQTLGGCKFAVGDLVEFDVSEAIVVPEAERVEKVRKKKAEYAVRRQQHALESAQRELESARQNLDRLRGSPLITKGQ